MKGREAEGAIRGEMMRRLVRPLLYLWAFPATAVGLFLALAAVLTGGRARIVRGVLEVHGGFARRLLRRGGGAAMTLGHVILGRDQACLDHSRGHERVHVRQFERWGPLLLPLYALAGWSARRRGLDAHLDNQFEQEAYEHGGDR
jgi:hypothetical protein